MDVAMFAFMTLMALAQTAAAQTPVSTLSVKAVEWMAGCWEGHRGPSTFRESWTKASDEAMFGVSYTTGAGGKLEEFEFLRVAVRQGRLVYLAQPGGRAETAFELTAGANAREAIFANPAHDFPKRVAYRATATGLLAWIDGGDAPASRRIEFPMTRVACDTVFK